MNYPTISEYVESIMLAEDNFDQLSSLRPVLDSYGNPVMSSGNFAVVFKMKDIDTGKFYAVKCFIKDQKGRNESYAMIADEIKNVSSPYIVPIRFLERELFVDSSQSDETEFPVLVMDWVEGKTLDAYLRENLEKKYSLQLLTYRFCQMSAWLMEQPFAHGDLKPDNILVREDGSLVLVDYDGFYVPAMNGQEARELGSPDFRHPQRTSQDFDEHIDDFSIATIALSLKAISLDSQLYNTHEASDRLLLSSTDYHDIGNSATMQKIVQLASDTELATIVGAFYIVLAQRQFDSVKFEKLVPKTPQLVTIVIQGNGEIITKKDVNAQLLENTFDDIWLQLSGNAKKSEVLVHVQIAEGVQCIEDRAFEGINNIFEVTIPKSMRGLGRYAFRDCKGLEVINFNAVNCVNGYYYQKSHGDCDIEDFWDPAFDGCENVKIINIGNQVKEIPEYAFSCLNMVTKVVIPESVTKIDFCAFENCTGLREVIIPESVTEIGSFAFENCINLTTINIPSSINEISTGLFRGCRTLTNIDLPKSINKIENAAFKGCSRLNEISIPNSVIEIGDNAFAECVKLENMNIPNSVTKIGFNPFSGCSKLDKIESNTNEYISEDGILFTNDRSKIVAFPCGKKGEYIIPNFVAEIGSYAFSGCANLTSIVIPTSVTKIGYDAFSGCLNLEEIIIPKSIIKIGSGAFSKCKNLKKVYFDAVECDYGSRDMWDSRSIFEGCGNLSNVFIGPNVKYIPSCFLSGSNVKKIVIPSSVVTIGRSAFRGCTGLREIIIPNSVTEIGNAAFKGCTGLREISIPDSVSKIGLWAFENCTGLREVVIPESVAYIGFCAFNNCTGLTEVIIGGLETRIEDRAFIQCVNLERIVIPQGTRQKFEEMLDIELHSKLVEL